MNFIEYLDSQNEENILIITNKIPKIDQENTKDIIIHIAKEFSTALLKSQNKGYEHINCTLDLQEFKLTNINYDFIKNLSDIMCQLFPNRLKNCFIINSPKLFVSSYKLIRNFIDPITRNKFIFIDGNNLILCEELN